MTTDSLSWAERFQATQRQLAAERDHLRVLLEVTTALVSNLDLPRLAAAVSSSLERAIPHEFTAILLHDPGSNQLVIRAVAAKSSDGLRHEGRRLPIAGSHAGEAFTARRTLVFGEDDLSDRFADTTAQLRQAGIRSVCDVPLVACDHSLGTLTVGSLQPDAFTPESVGMIEDVARQVAMAVSNALAFQEIAQLKDKLERRRPRTGRDDGGATLEGVERTHILRVLQETNWMLGGPRGAATRLGMKRTTLQSLMGRLGITRPGLRRAADSGATSRHSSKGT